MVQDSVKKQAEQISSTFNGVLLKGRVMKSSLVFTVLSIEGRIEEMSGYPKKNFLNHEIDISAHIHPDDVNTIFLPTWRNIVKNPQLMHELEYRIVKKDGTVKWVHSVIFNIRNYTEKLEYQAILCDCTNENQNLIELKKSESNLKKITKEFRKSEDKYKLITENINEIISLFDKDLKLLYINRNQQKVSGFTREELLSKSPLDFMHPDDTKNALKLFRDTMRKGHGKGQYRMQRKDGSYAWIEASGKKFFSEDGEERYVLISRDITEKKIAQESLKHSDERHRQLFYNSPIPLLEVQITPIEDSTVILDELLLAIKKSYTFEKSIEFIQAIPYKITILNLNSACLKLFKFEIKEQFIVNFEYLCRKIIIDTFLRVQNQNDISGLNLSFESEAQDKYDNWMYLEINISCLSDSEDAKTFLIAMSDITQRREFEKNRQSLLDHLIRTLEFKSKFLATISHELRTPLNSILGFSELLKETLAGNIPPDQEEYIEDIHSSGEHLLNLINRLLDHSRLESGEVELEYKKFNLSEMVNKICLSFKPLISKKLLTLTVEGINKVAEITADPIRFKQILNNLLSNAIKFTEDGEILLNAIEKSDHWEFQVRDTGIGIAPEYYDIIFREFGRVNQYLSKEIPGTGLGLSLTKRLVQLHGGEIWFQSKLGKGSSFYFVIPKKTINAINS